VHTTNRPAVSPAPLDFAARQRRAATESARAYADGTAPAVAAGLASADRALASIEAAVAPTVAPAPEPAPTEPEPTEPAPGVELDAMLRCYGVDATALRTVDPAAYLAFGSMFCNLRDQLQVLIQNATQAAMAAAMVSAMVSSEAKPYVAAPDARNALRHSLHQTGVIPKSDHGLARARR
jgi:hypothetical protein